MTVTHVSHERLLLRRVSETSWSNWNDFEQKAQTITMQVKLGVEEPTSIRPNAMELVVSNNSRYDDIHTFSNMNRFYFYRISS